MEHEYGASADIEDTFYEGRVCCALCGKHTNDVPCKDHQPQAYAEHVKG